MLTFVTPASIIKEVGRCVQMVHMRLMKPPWKESFPLSVIQGGIENPNVWKKLSFREGYSPVLISINKISLHEWVGSFFLQ